MTDRPAAPPPSLILFPLFYGGMVALSAVLVPAIIWGVV